LVSCLLILLALNRKVLLSFRTIFNGLGDLDNPSSVKTGCLTPLYVEACTVRY
jgi:anthranilate phosphoribosyltransferase